MSKLTFSETGLQYRSEIFKGTSNELTKPAESRKSNRPTFLIRKGEPSKLLLLKDGHIKFDNYTSNDIKRLGRSLFTTQFNLSRTLSSQKIQIPQSGSKQAKVQFSNEVSAQKSLKNSDEVITSNNLDFSALSPNQMSVQRTLSEFLNIPKTCIQQIQRSSSHRRNNFRFQSFKEMHFEDMKNLKSDINRKLEQIQSERDQPVHVSKQFLNTMQTEQTKLDSLLVLAQTFTQRQKDRIKDVHKSKYQAKWKQIHLPQMKNKNSKVLKRVLSQSQIESQQGNADQQNIDDEHE